jgi:1-acyl-sn-glycerol-3-phosphate acyltransferase
MNELHEVRPTWFKHYGYRFCHAMCRLTATFAYHIRFFGQEHFPATGGGLVCANHQSHLDPVLIGICCPRPLNFLAKKSLFKFKPFGMLIDFLNAIPLEREGSPVAGVKETIRRTRRGELLLIFPEGARTFDGELSKILPGTAAIAKRSQVPLIPVGIDGAFHAWPRTKPFPQLGHVVVYVDKPIPYSEYGSLSDEEISELLRQRITACFAEARRRRRAML